MLRDIQAWFSKRVPESWFESGPDVTADTEEILVLGTLRAQARGAQARGARATAASDAERAAAIKDFREASREQRMRIAAEAEERFGRPVAWGARCDGLEMVFTSQSTPMMTRLRMQERRVLDTLIEAGVARTRSDALGWCVRLVGQHEADWLRDLREALVKVQEVRAAGPRSQ
jgi:hypothetical protein